ncbi:MAG: hypothetical protein SGBAC_007030 [Bacillariaceae sp.]
MIHRVQNRDNILCRERFSVGPYYIQFAFSIEGRKKENASIIVEVSSRLDLPHAVLTFLALVEAQHYTGFKVFWSLPALSIAVDEANQLDDMFKTPQITGMTQGFIESSPKFPCVKHSVGFLGYGPRFMIVFESDGEQEISGQTCFGRVVRGINSLQILQTEAARGSNIQVIWSRILDV